MALENTQTFITYQGTGTGTAFPVPFPVLDKSHLVVHSRPAATGSETLLAMGNDYSVIVAADGAGATVTLNKALAVGAFLKIERRVPLTQENIFHNQGPNYAQVIERTADKLTMITQQLSIDLASGNERLAALDGEIVALGKTDARLNDSIAGLGQAKADRSELLAAVGGLNNTDAVLQTQIDGLAREKADTIHAAQHDRYGKDPLTPTAIGALGESHAAETDPHPQYAFRGGDWQSYSFFDYVLSDGLTLKAAVPEESTSYYFLLTSEGVALKGIV